MIKVPPSLGSRLVFIYFSSQVSVRITPKAVVISPENFLFFGGGGGKERRKRPGVAFPSGKLGEATAGCHFRMWRWGKLASVHWTRESGLTDLARRQSLWGPRSRRQSRVAGLRTLAGRKPPPSGAARVAGETPRGPGHPRIPLLLAAPIGLKRAREPVRRPSARACLPRRQPRRASCPASHPSHLPRHLSERSWEAPSCRTPCYPAARHPGREGCSQAPRSGSTPAGCGRRG